MGILIVLLLVLAFLLIFTPPEERAFAVGIISAIAVASWVVFQLKLWTLFGSMLGSLLDLLWDNWQAVLVALAASIVLIVPALMIYLVVCDRLDDRAIRKEFLESSGTVTKKLDSRVHELMRVGYDRQRAETVALNLVDKELKRKLETWFSPKSESPLTYTPGPDHIFRP
jgi:MFS family permease